MKKTLIIILTLCASAALAQQKQRVAVLPSVGDLDPQRLILLTDKVREIATKNLPMEGFNILKQDVITRMIGEEELYKACKDGVCIGDLAKKTNANYGARCDIVKLDNSLVLKFELYSVNEEAIFETFTDYDVKDFRGMLTVLEARLPAAYQKMITASKPREAVGGIGGVEYGARAYTVNLSTVPSGAGLSFNGAPIDGCAKSPCRAELPEGKIRVLAALAQYETADTTVTIKSNNQNITISLKPNIGLLTIKPAYSENIGVNKGWGLSINGKGYSAYENALSPGNYAVRLSHDCYEEIHFKASIVKGKNEVFNMAEHLRLKTGGLELEAERDGRPVSEPVFVNGSPAGETPFDGEVSVCSEITIGNGRDKVNVTLAHNETVRARHIFPATPAITPEARPEPPPVAAQRAAPRKKASPVKLTLRGVSGVAAGIGLVGGLGVNGTVDKLLKDYSAERSSSSRVDELKSDIDNNVATRNALYALGLIGLAGFTVTFLF